MKNNLELTVNERFISLIKALKNVYGIGQSAIARELKVGRSQIADIVNGRPGKYATLSLTSKLIKAYKDMPRVAKEVNELHQAFVALTDIEANIRPAEDTTQKVKGDLQELYNKINYAVDNIKTAGGDFEQVNQQIHWVQKQIKILIDRLGGK